MGYLMKAHQSESKVVPVPRRQFLGMLSSAPLLFSGSSLLALTACGGGGETPASQARPLSVKFNGMAAPVSVADRAAVYTAATLDISYSDGTKKTAQPLSFKTIYKTGDVLKHPVDGTNVLAGGYYLPDGITPIIDTTGSNAEQFYSDCVDGQSLISLANPDVPGITGNTLFLVTQFEYKSKNNAGASMYGQLPSPIAVATLDQNKTTGDLTVKHYYNVPTESVHGLWITCAGSLSPWNTHLSSEEYQPDAWRVATNTTFKAFSLNTFGSETAANPYHYGHVPEVTVHPDGTGSIVKHYNLGRVSRELVQVMPDRRTVLMGDDFTNGGLFMFVADVEGVLSSGTLYAAKLTQTSAAQSVDGGHFTFQWIKLGHANSVEIKALADSLTVSNIIDVKAIADFADDAAATAAGYSRVNLDGVAEYVKILPGMDKAAAFLETHRYASIKGATMEMTKFEGVTVNVKDKVAYLAMSRLEKSMQDGAGDVNVKKVMAGAVYEVNLDGSINDTGSASINSAWVPVNMAVPAALLGEDKSKDSDGNTAVVDKIANPDNVKYSESLRTLFIGEDSGMHLNNFVWAYNVDSKLLSRVLSVPAGAECTGLQAVDNLNGHAYLMSAFQHAGDWNFTSPAQDDLKAAVAANWGGAMKKSATGYISGLPVIE